MKGDPSRRPGCSFSPAVNWFRAVDAEEDKGEEGNEASEAGEAGEVGDRDDDEVKTEQEDVIEEGRTAVLVLWALVADSLG